MILDDPRLNWIWVQRMVKFLMSSIVDERGTIDPCLQ
jgi:hypothetical protein